jgi:flavin-dependent dehydrogenase
MSIPIQCDVLVIGGGPAGSMAATYLSQKGYEVVLLEKQKHPRYQVGESLVPQFWKFADAARVSRKIEEEKFVQKSGGTVLWNGLLRQLSFKDFGYTRPALHIERDRFDHILIEHARAEGAKVFEEVTVTQVNLDGGPTPRATYRRAGDTTPGTIACRYVVDATGQTALIGRQRDLRLIDDDFRFMSVWGYFQGSHYLGVDGQIYPPEQVRKVLPTTFIASTGNWGWSWHIQMRTLTSVGLIVPQQEVQASKATDADLEAYFRRRCGEIPILSRLLEPARYCEGQFHAMRHYSYRPRQLAGPGFYLVGDAAAFIDPVFSEGCLLAFYSAFLAAWAIDRSLRHPDRATQSQALFSSHFAGRYEIGHALALPRFGGFGKVSDTARRSIGFDCTRERELMYTASTITGRPENLQELLPDEQDRIRRTYRTLTPISA